MEPQPLDLFGEVPVTFEDIDAWLLAVPRIDPSSWRAHHYVRQYKRAGEDSHREARRAGFTA